MKISFVRILNSSLPQPYPDLSTDILYLTNKGYVYPEGSDKPIDLFDPELISKITDNKLTTINTDEQLNIRENWTTDMFMDTIKQNRDMFSYIRQVRYATVKSISIEFNLTKEQVKEKVAVLTKLGTLTKYQSYIVLTDDFKPLLDFELAKG